jgi:hypothetical protein
LRFHRAPLLEDAVVKIWPSWFVVWTVACFSASLALGADIAGSGPESNRTLKVPADYATIQAAIDAADDGATVLVSPGVYHESLRLAEKSVRLVSEFAATRDKDAVRTTILDGTTTDAAGRVRTRDQVILVDASAGPATQIVGFTIRNGDDGISCEADVRIAHNYFTGNDDAIDYEGGGGLCVYNKFEKNTDDAVDYDLDCDATVVHNEIIDNEDDGIEIRLQDYRGKTLELTIRDNVITGNGEDGIQIIDYPGLSDRRIRIERNLIARNAMAGIGCMGDAVSEEDYRGADIPEPIEILNNTIAENEYGITGGDNVVVANNIFIRHRHAALKRVDGRSVIAHNLFWKNGSSCLDCSEHEAGMISEDPVLDVSYRPASTSVCIDAGTAQIDVAEGRSVVVGREFEGAAPDLGAFEATQF